MRRVLCNSPSIDTGDPSSPFDPDGSPADQGWLTFQPPRPILRDIQYLPDGTTRFVLDAYTNRNYVIDFSADATSWNPLRTIAQPVELTPVVDGTSTNAAHRLYRARLAP